MKKRAAEWRARDFDGRRSACFEIVKAGLIWDPLPHFIRDPLYQHGKRHDIGDRGAGIGLAGMLDVVDTSDQSENVADLIATRAPQETQSPAAPASVSARLE